MIGRLVTTWRSADSAVLGIEHVQPTDTAADDRRFMVAFFHGVIV
jgi:hypothetical protein